MSISKTGIWDGDTLDTHQHSPKIAQFLCEYLDKNKFTVDFGAGLGYYLKELEIAGFTKLIGVEGTLIEKSLFGNMVAKDLTTPLNLYVKGNVISLEVFEHIPKKYEQVFLDTITKHCDNILVMSAAIPNQCGNGHVNEVENDYVIKEVTKRGFEFIESDTKWIRNNVDDSCCYFRKSLLIFRKVN